MNAKFWFVDKILIYFDKTPYLDKGVFRELAEPSYFRFVRVCGGSICWPHDQELRRRSEYEMF